MRKARLAKVLSFEEDGAHWPKLAFHLEGAMGASQTVLPFKLAATDEALTAHGGLALVGEYVRAMGICSLIDHKLPRPGTEIPDRPDGQEQHEQSEPHSYRRGEPHMCHVDLPSGP
jgi:hypothetical protein